MAKIRIRNFGPIKQGALEDDGWLEIKKVTVFIGNQGSGKSTVAKLISTCSWIEKALTRGDYEKDWFKNRFKDTYCAYHRLQNYFLNDLNEDNAEIEYYGESYHMRYYKGELNIQDREKGQYELPQIMYVPAERNFISTVSRPSVLRFSSAPLVDFVTEFDKAKQLIEGSLMLPVNSVVVEYDNVKDVVQIKGKDYKVLLTESSSGFQSIVPLFLVSWSLAHSVNRQVRESRGESMSSEELERFRKGVAEIWGNNSLTEEQRRNALSELGKKFNKTAFINIVEEPEQNLYPESQRRLLNSLLLLNNLLPGNTLIMTTHSPFIISFLSIAIEGMNVLKKLKEAGKTDQYLQELNDIIPPFSVIEAENVVVYEFDEITGSITKLPHIHDIPSDDNYLNQALATSNDLFDKLLKIEQSL